MRTRTIIMCVAMLATAAIAGAARADWEPSMPAKWVQMPDLETGMDVNATWKQGATGGPQYPFIKTLADDFLCRSVEPITDVHVWGSWLDNRINPNVTFKLSIHDDVPKSPTGGYSYPGNLLWQRFFSPGQYVGRPWATAVEDFFEPNTNTIIGSDTQVYQYNFYIPPAEAFIQQGNKDNPKVYWLDVMAILPIGSPEVFGWKTSIDHWNDDAVFGDTNDPNFSPTQWMELRDPRLANHPSLDLAFVITPEPATMALLGLGVAGLVARRRSKK